MNDNPTVNTEVMVTQPLNTLSTMTKENFEEDCGYKLTDDEFKRILTYGNVVKKVNNVNVNIQLHITDSESPFSDFVTFIIDKCQGVHDIFVTGFMVNDADILECNDGELSAHDCAMFLLDFGQYNEIYELSITFPPNTVQDIINR